MLKSIALKFTRDRGQTVRTDIPFPRRPSGTATESRCWFSLSSDTTRPRPPPAHPVIRLTTESRVARGMSCSSFG